MTRINMVMAAFVLMTAGCADSVEDPVYVPPARDSGIDPWAPAPTPPSRPPPPAPVPAPPAPPACTVEIVGDAVVDSCAAPDICIAARGTCEPAGGRRYAILLAWVSLPERTIETSECWDEACGAPDPVVEVEIDGVVIGRTEESSDTFSAEYDPLVRIDATLQLGSTLRMVAYDVDFAFDDPAFECTLFLTPEALRERVASCFDPTGQFGIGAAVVAVEDAT